MGRSSETRVDPSIQIQNEVIANAATLEKNVMVTERLISPPSMAVQKLEPTPPGQQPSSSRPSLSYLVSRIRYPRP